MLALLLLALPGTSQQHSFLGLSSAESAQPLARFEGEDEEECVRMRFLDGTTGQPLEGVRVEAWTEPGSKPLQVETRIDDVRSAADGSVRVHWRKGEVRGEKLRVSKPGYESQQCGADPGEMLLLPAQPLRGRVLDLDLHPIAGAIVRSRQSCAHALSASQTKTAHDGSFTLEDFPISETPELEVLADGYSARGEIDPLVLRQQDLDARAQGGSGCTILLARCAPWRLRLLDASGAPLARRRVGTTERPVIAQQTDAEGACSFTLPEGAKSLYLETCDDGPRSTFSIPMVPRGGVTNVRALEARMDRATTSLRVSTRALPLSAEARANVSVFSEDGFVWSGPDHEAIEVPRGKARVVVSGECCEYLCEFVIEAGEQPIVCAVEAPSPWPSVALPKSEVHAPDRLLTQFGSRSDFGEPAPPAGKDCWISRASPGSTAAFALHEANGAVRVAHLAPDAERVADLRAHFHEPGCEVVPGLASAPAISVPWRGRSECPAASGTLWPALLPCPELRGDSMLELPEGRLYYAEFAGARGVPRHVLRRASAGEDQRIELVRRARLVLEGDVARVSSFEGGVEPEGARFVLEPAPGPLFVRVEHRDGTASLLSLVLSPGEERTLVAR